MINLSKSADYFNPAEVTEEIHIIGCGAVGSNLATLLVRFGLTHITLWDMDTVDAHNIVNQCYDATDIGKLKTEALGAHLQAINPDIVDDLTLQGAYEGQRLSGYVFLAVDNIDLRRDIVTKLKSNQYVKAVFDFRIRLEDSQCYAADWRNIKQVDNLLNSMDFTHDEAKSENPVSACNVELGVAPTALQCVTAGLCNFINFVKGRGLKKLILLDSFGFVIQAY